MKFLILLPPVPYSFLLTKGKAVFSAKQLYEIGHRKIVSLLLVSTAMVAQSDQFMPPAADFTAYVHLRNVYGTSCAINVAKVDLRSCIKFCEICYKCCASGLTQVQKVS